MEVAGKGGSRLMKGLIDVILCCFPKILDSL
jgi:hypothetical protein